MRRFPKIFFGWWTVLTAGFLALWGGGYRTYGISVLFKPIASELGLSRAAVSVPTSIARLEGGFESPLVGWLVDRFGPRWLLLPAVFIFGLSFILMNYVGSFWAFVIVWGVLLGTAHNVTSGVVPDKAVTNWFVKKRGLALSIKAVLAGLGGATVLPLVAWLITIQGWRMACVAGGVIMWLVGLPLVWFFIKQHRPEYYGLLPDGAASEETVADTSRMIEKGVKYANEAEEIEFTLRQAMGTPAFWVLMVVNAIHNMVAPAINTHGVPFLTDKGIDPLVAANIFAMMLFVSLPGRLVGGFFADRVGRRHLRFVLLGAYFMQALGFAVFLLHQTVPMIYVWFILYGIGLGIPVAVLPSMRGRYFGRKAFGSIQGISQMIAAPIGVAAPIYCGWVYDTTGSYITAFTLIAALLGFSAVLTAFILPPKPPVQVTDVHKFL